MCVCVINIYEFFAVSVVFAVTAPISNGDNVVYYLMRCTQIKSGLVRPYQYGEFTYQTCNLVVMGHFFEKLKKRRNYIIYKYFKPKYLSCQYSHLAVVAWIQLIEMKVKSGEPKRWKMKKADYDRIMENCIPITHCLEE